MCEKAKLEMVLTGTTVLNLSAPFIQGKSRGCILDFLHFQYGADRLELLRQCVRCSPNSLLLCGHMFACFLGVDSYIRLNSFLKELHSLSTEQIKPSISYAKYFNERNASGLLNLSIPLSFWTYVEVA